MSDDGYIAELKDRLKEAQELRTILEQSLVYENNPLEREKLKLQIKQTQKRIEEIEKQISEELEKQGELAKSPTKLYFHYNYNNLIGKDSELFGRDEDLWKLDEVLKDGGCVAVLGVGGQGKTALAYAYMRPYLDGPDRFERAVWLTVEGGGSDLNTLAGLLGLPTATRPDETAEGVRQYLCTCPALVTLDNLDSAIEDGKVPLDVEALLKRLIELRGPSRVIITSREWPSRLIHPRHLLRLEGLSPEAGANLLAECGLHDEPHPKLLLAAQKAKGHPFALKLLADLVANSTAGDTLDDLLQQGDLWDKELAEQLLRKVWDSRLNDEERRLLQILTVLRPPARRPTLLHLLNNPDERRLRELLNGMGDKALVSAERDSKDSKKVIGHDLHPLLRRFVQSQELSADQRENLHRTAAAYFQSLIPTLLPKENYRRKSIEDVWPILEAIHHLNELGNYQAACDLFFDEDLHDDLDRWGESTVLIAIYEQWTSLKTSLPPLRKGSQGAVISNLGLAYSTLGQFDKAIKHYQQALLIARESNDKQGEGSSLGNLGLVYSTLGQFNKAIEQYQQALLIAREINDKQSEGIHLGNLGIAYSTLSQFDKAIEQYQQALLIAREINDKQSEGAHLGNLGNAYCQLGQSEKAIEQHQQALLIVREIDYKQGEGNLLGSLGIAYYQLGQFDKAIEQHQQALLIAREINDRQSEGSHLGNLGKAYYKLGQFDKARDLCQQALLIAREIGDRQNEGIQLGNLGESYVVLGNLDKAIEYYQAGLKISREVGDKVNIGEILKNFGCAYEKLDQLPKALAHWRVAVDIFTEIKSPLAQESQDHLDRVKQEQGEEEFTRLGAASEAEYQELRMK
jgi:tetratricopeptide (TPR) repeat protein